MAKKRGPLSLEHKAKLVLAHTGHVCSEETKRKISVANRGRCLTYPQWNKGKKTGPLSQEHREKLRVAGSKHPGNFTGKKHTLETKLLIGRNSTRLTAMTHVSNQELEFQDVLLEASRDKQNGWEALKFQSRCSKLQGIRHTCFGRVSDLRNHPFDAEIVLSTGESVFIDYNGCWTHACALHANGVTRRTLDAKDRDVAILSAARVAGVNVIYLDEHECTENGHVVKEKLQTLLKERCPQLFISSHKRLNMRQQIHTFPTS